MKVSLRGVAFGMAMVVAGAARAEGGAATAPAMLTFDDKGATVGEQLPDLGLLTLDNEPVDLRSQLEGTTLLVTSSFTCPKSRENFPGLAELAAKYGKRLHIVILYVIEAHPAGDPSPYRNGKEDVTPQNQRDGILRRQPVKIEKRVALANEFCDHFASKIPVVVDGMDNFGWKSVGAGPNMAILLTSERKVLARQGWFDAKSLGVEIDKALARKGEVRGGYLNAGDEAIAKELGKRELRWWEFMEEPNLLTLRKLLTEFPTLNHYVDEYMQKGNSGGETFLQMAAEGNHVTAAKLLLESGADVEQYTPRKPSALFMAASAGHEGMVELLIPHVKHVDLRYEEGPTAMQEALYQQHGKVAEMLKKAGARENFFTHVARGDAAEVGAAIGLDDSVAGRPDGMGRTPLMYAAATGQIEIGKLLVKAGAPVNPPAGAYDGLAVPVAVEHHHDEMLAWLLGVGGDANRGDGYGGGPLQTAARLGDAAAVGMLLKAGAKPGEQDVGGFTALHNAAAAGQAGVIPLLLDAGMDVNAASGVDRSPCGPDIAPTPHLETPLMLAAGSGKVEAVKVLLVRKADAGLSDVDYRTALHAAVESFGGKPEEVKEVVKVLLDAKAPVNEEDVEGHTALDIAKEHDLKEVVKLLEEHGAKAGSGTVRNRKPAPKKGEGLFGGGG